MPQAPAVAPFETVVPDCCNIGVVARALVGVNFTVFLAEYAAGSGLRGLLGASVLVEPVCLASLVSLCGLRRLRHFSRVIPPWCQRALCGLVPAAIASFVIQFVLSVPGGQFDLSVVPATEGMVVAGAFGLALQHYFELRMRAFSPALSEAKLQALQARIRPHFLFNSLNAVLSLIRTEPLRAESTLEDLSDLFRVLMRDARDVTSLEEEIRLCRQYLSIEKVRLGERLQVQWKTEGISDKMLKKARVPSLLLQPLLENAVHYGVEAVSEPVTIEIGLQRHADRILVAIFNPIPIAAAAQGGRVGNHMALENIRERLALLYDVEAQLTAGPVGGRFEVRLQLPYVRGD
ncbi:MAG TPA: histidine kinase [Burkholderiaceae bacterium]